MVAGNTLDTNFIAVSSQAGIEMDFDRSNGNPDSTAIGMWYAEEEDLKRSKREVYIIDRGIDEVNPNVGLKKVQFSIEGNRYLIRYADLDNQHEMSQSIDRSDSINYIYFSFDNGVVDIAPNRIHWSLLFSRYTTMLVTDEGENYPYLVSGVVLNPNGVAAALDTIHNFLEIELGDTIDLQLSTRADLIGYDWKYYDFDAGVYTIVPEYAYVIRDRDGFYYKMRFVDFYNGTGEKGYPKFEYARL